MKEALENIKKHVVSDQSDRQGSVVLALPGAASTYEYEQYIPDAPYHCGNRCNPSSSDLEQHQYVDALLDALEEDEAFRVTCDGEGGRSGPWRARAGRRPHRTRVTS